MFSTQLMFWIAVVLLFYIYLGYPGLIWAWANRVQRNRSRLVEFSGSVPGQALQATVSLLVVAHNEEDRIASRIENLLALDYSPDLLEIVIASDGSTDRTVARAESFRGNKIKIVVFPVQRGKPAVLNQLIPNLQGDIIVLLDVRQRLEPQAIQELLAAFRDPQTGAASGELILEKPQSVTASVEAGEGVGFYWRYEKFIRRQESCVDSTVGVTGAIYAIRQSLFRPIPVDTLLDDVLIPMSIVRQGYRVLFESSARAFDQVSASAQSEFTRKVRTIAGNYQLFFSHPWLLNPFVNRLWFQTLSHKFLRLMSPLFLLILLIANLLLLDHLFYQLFLVAQLLFYVAAAGAHLRRPAARPRILLSVPYAFCLLNWATLVGLFRFMFRIQKVTWKKSEG